MTEILDQQATTETSANEITLTRTRWPGLKLFPRPRKRARRWRFVGPFVATIGTSILAYLALWQFFHVPGDALHRLSVVGLIALAVGIGVLTNVSSIFELRREVAEGKNHGVLHDRVIPTLYQGMEEVVDRWTAGVIPALDEFGSENRAAEFQIDDLVEIEMHVFLKIGGYHRIVASSAERHANVRRLKLADNEGVIGSVYGRNAAVIAEIGTGYRATLLNRLGQPLGDQPPLRERNVEKCHSDLKWVYATPIFDPMSTRPYSNRTIGVLAVDGLHSASNQMYLDPSFQDLVEAVALQVAPFVSACEGVLEMNHNSPEDEE